MTGGVRPLDVEPEPPRRGLLLATAAVVVLAGFGVYLASGGLSESAPTTTAGPTATSLASPTTTTTGPPPLLGESVPGFQGRVRGVQTIDNLFFGWTWSSGDTAARLTPLPGDARGSWDSGLTSLAVIAESSFDTSLFYGPANDVREVHNGVESFAWHSGDPDSIAWVSLPQSDGMRELWRSLPPSSESTRGFSASLVMRFGFEATLVGYGDFGYAFAVTSPSPDRPLQLVTYDLEGGLLAQASAAFADAAGERLLVMTGSPGVDRRLAVTDPQLARFEPVGPEDVSGGVFSPDSRWVAAVGGGSSGAALSISRLGTVSPAADDVVETVPIPLGVDSAVPVSWSSDGRWILLLAGWDEPDAATGTLLLFVDTGAERVYPVTAPGEVSGLGIEATGAPGPTSRYFVP